jgi:hypothetical protein
MSSIIEKYNIKYFLLIIILLFIFYLFINEYDSYVSVPVYIKDYSNPHIRIYCLILTTPQYFDTRARAVNSTWAPRCDKFSFISEYSNDTKGLPIAPLANISSGYGHLTQKTTLALHYVYEKYLNDFDWFVKADDDTYIFVDNLKSFLKEQNPSEPITFGHNFNVNVLTKSFNNTINRDFEDFLAYSEKNHDTHLSKKIGEFPCVCLFR